jgi:hypothetical protein
MDIGALFLLALVLAFIVLFVSRPFFEGTHVSRKKQSQQLSALLAERETLLSTILELDSDLALQKIPPDEYPRQRSDLLQKGADILRQIDALDTDLGVKTTVQVTVPPVIYSSISPPLSDDDLEEMLSRRRFIRKDKTGGFCPKCGKPVLFTDAFCPSCGHALK